MDINSLTPHYFEWVVRAMADMAIKLAQQPKPQAREMRWQALFGGTPVAAPARPRRASAGSKK
jgi:hypothetical protein